MASFHNVRIVNHIVDKKEINFILSTMFMDNDERGTDICICDLSMSVSLHVYVCVVIMLYFNIHVPCCGTYL